MKRNAGCATQRLALAVLALSTSVAVLAQQNAIPPAEMTPEEMRQMNGEPPGGVASRNTHAAQPDLERPAASENEKAPMMAGMDTDMNDAALQHRIWVENLEGVWGPDDGGAWDAQAWLGGDFDKLWVKTQGAKLAGKTEGAKVEALWARAILPDWDAQVGIRHDFGFGPSREWAALGVQGIAPYWFDLELTGYVGEQGRTAARFKAEYDVRFTQRWVLKPEIELNAYGAPDRARELGAGLADGQFELRLRYEVTRRFAPYAGFVYDRQFAGTAWLEREAGQPAIDHRAVAGADLFF